MGDLGTATAREETAVIDSGDTAWIVMSSALVLLMTPGLALFYGGLVRRKNILSVFMQCLAAICIVGLQWVLFGYSLAFGPDHAGIIGGLSFAGLHGVGLDPNPDYAGTIPHLLFMVYQMMFAVITPALIIGAFAERMKFSAFLVFSLLWATLVYDPLAHWIWGVGGFLREYGALDFAGGAVVHISAGMGALASAIVVGKRHGYPETGSPHNLVLVALGAALLWFGWFGFNGGSALASGKISALAFVTTQLAAMSGAIAWVFLDWILAKRPTTLGLLSGLIAGLAAVTPASGFVGPMGALAIGAIAGLVCYLSVMFVKTKFQYDDSLDAFGIHGVAGSWGVLAVGIWASLSLNPAGADGLIHGKGHQLLVQFVTFLIASSFSFVASFILLKLVDKTMGLRVRKDHELIGLDLTQHKESAYTFLG
jgi:ammonium transporter, Amt family